MVALKLACAGGFWFGAIPIAIGLFFELLAVIPLRVPLDETPCHFLYSCTRTGRSVRAPASQSACTCTVRPAGRLVAVVGVIAV